MYPIIIILLIFAFALTIWAQFKVKSTYKKWTKVPVSTGITGQQVARKILDNNGLYDVEVRPVNGTLSDHYDPTRRVVNLSEDVYYGNSISSVSIASHEVGHAIQHQEDYGMLVIRHKLVPVTNFASGIAPLLIIGGFLFNALNLAGLGVIFFSIVVLFQVVTLPVEFNASSRARSLIVAEGFIQNDEERGVAKVLNAAALTYVAAALYALLELFRYIIIFAGLNDD